MKEKLDLSGEGKASDVEIELAANTLYNKIRCFNSPKDAGAAFTLAHYKFLCAAFPPENRKEAFAAIDDHCKLLKEFLNEGWQ